MLQQTQTHRVLPKYLNFVEEFSSFNALAQASLRDVLSMWQGLGYNRRGMYLHQIAQKIVKEHAGILPNDPHILETFPGIGKATAASICAFAYNTPTVFIETNIRSVFIHFFFEAQTQVHDRELFPLVAESLAFENAREWYYALMDYGVMLKQKYPNPSRRSKHHTQQSKFIGSDRQIRGVIIRLLTQYQSLNRNRLIDLTEKECERVSAIIDDLSREGLIVVTNNSVQIR